MSSIAARSLLRTTTRSLSRSSKAPLCSSSRLVQTPLKASRSPIAQLQSARAFSTTMAPQSGAPPPGKAPEYDPEIKDMADYIHNYKIDSDLAVWQKNEVMETFSANNAPLDRHCSFRFPRHNRLRSQSPRIPFLHKASRPNCARHHSPQWHPCARNSICP